MTIEEFRERILSEDLDDILANVLLSDDAKHVDLKNREYIKSKIANAYSIDATEIQLIVVGSAKLGFSISEKKNKDGVKLPRYRMFRPESDIDLAVISPAIYEAIWNELSRFSFSQTYSPWDSGKLGDYMVCGWLRPDHFPKHRRLRKCDDWWDLFRQLSAEQRLGRKQIRGGLFYNYEQLKAYQSKALADCIQFERLR